MEAPLFPKRACSWALFALFGKLIHFGTPYMRFLFVRPRVCLRLLSAVSLAAAVLPLASSFTVNPAGDFHPQVKCPCRAQSGRGQALPAPPHTTARAVLQAAIRPLLPCLWVVVTCLQLHSLVDFLRAGNPPPLQIRIGHGLCQDLAV